MARSHASVAPPGAAGAGADAPGGADGGLVEGGQGEGGLGEGGLVEGGLGAGSGSWVGQYQLMQRLGVGGMAEVYVARRVGPHGFVKRVALKCMLPDLACDSRFVEMFCDEARVMASLHHPNLVQVLDFGEAERATSRGGARLFMALEYVDGLSCAKLLRAVAAKGKAFPHGAALYIASEVLSGLAYAHEYCDEQGRMLGLVHRDVSPGNILIGRTGEVKLTDFGILKSEILTRRTLPGELKGKLGYMSPEQVIGSEVDARSDLFTLGIVLSEMLLARPMFPGRNELDILSRIHDGDLGVLDRHGGSLPPVLSALLRRALARDPRDRFPNAREFRHETHRAMAQLGLAPTDSELLPWLHEAKVLPNQSGTRAKADFYPDLSGRRSSPPRPARSSLTPGCPPSRRTPEHGEQNRTLPEFPDLGAQSAASRATARPGSPKHSQRPPLRDLAPTTPPRPRRQESGRPTLPVGALAGRPLRVRQAELQRPELQRPELQRPELQQPELQRPRSGEARKASSRTAFLPAVREAGQRDALLPPAEGSVAPRDAARPPPPKPPRPPGATAAAPKSNARPSSGVGLRSPGAREALFPDAVRAGSGSEIRLARPGQLPIGPLSLPRLLEMAATGEVPRGSRIAFDGGPFLPVESQPALGRIVGRREFRLEAPALAPTWSVEISRAALVCRFLEIAALGATGLVILKAAVSGGARVKHLYFANGRPVCVLGNAPGELLGARLARAGDLQQDVLDSALRRCAVTGRRLGEELVSMGVLRPAALLRAVAHQVEERLLEAGRWRRGEAAFYAGISVAPDLSAQAPDANVWVRLVRACFSDEEIALWLSPLLDLPVERVQHAGAEALLRATNSPEALVLEFADAAPSLRSLLAALEHDGVARGGEAKRALFLGLCSGWLKFSGASAFQLPER